MAVTKKPRGRPRSFDLDEAAGKAGPLFWEYGYEGVSVDELTAAMGITTQSFYAAFKSKEQLYQRAIGWYEREVVEPLRAAGAGERDVVRGFRASLEACAREFTRPDLPAGCMRSFGGLGLSRANEAIARHATGLRLESTAHIKAGLDHGVAEGQLRADTDTMALARYVNAFVVGMAVTAHDGATTEDLLAMVVIAESVLEEARADQAT